MSQGPASLGAIDLLSLEQAEAPSFDELYQRHFSQVWRWSQDLGGPGFDAEDATQEVFLRVHRHHHKFRGDSHIVTWIYRITVNVVRTRQSRDRSWQQLRDAEDQRPEDAEIEDGSFANLQRLDLRESVHKILRGMNARDRLVLVAFEFEGLTGKELAEVLDVKESTLWVWINRARAVFRRRFKELGLMGDGADDL